MENKIHEKLKADTSESYLNDQKTADKNQPRNKIINNNANITHNNNHIGTLSDSKQLLLIGGIILTVLGICWFAPNMNIS